MLASVACVKSSITCVYWLNNFEMSLSVHVMSLQHWYQNGIVGRTAWSCVIHRNNVFLLQIHIVPPPATS